jgi:hypothetical protein
VIDGDERVQQWLDGVQTLGADAKNRTAPAHRRR